LDFGPDVAYASVWAKDAADPEHEAWGVESVVSVFTRARAVLFGLEPEAGPVLLCTHGDVASVLLCAAAGAPLGRHREIGPLVNGEIRSIDLPGGGQPTLFTGVTGGRR
jgi:broad specificity phosphatase PhoE